MFVASATQPQVSRSHSAPVARPEGTTVDRFSPSKAESPQFPPPPQWTVGAVAYGVIPPLFGNGEPINAVTGKLDRLDKLGIDALWLSPIQETDDIGQISYGATDFCKIRPDFGTDDDLKNLVKEAHKRGIKVLLDIAPNHVSIEHEYFQHVLDNGKESPYYDFFDRDENGDPTSYFDWDHLKNLNYARPEVQKLVTDAFEHWITEFDVDGFRVDAAWGPAERQPEFWGELNERLSKLKPDLYMLAEASAKDPYFVKNGFDAAYDWSKNMGEWAWDGVFNDDKGLGARLHTALTADSGTPPEQIARFLNNNDTAERFITRYGVDKTRTAATLMLTLPGMPVVYTGDEVGAEFLPYEDPPPISWKDSHKLKPHYQKLIGLRESVPALARGEFTPVPVTGSEAAYAYIRHTDGEEPVLVVLNFGAKAELEVQLPEQFRSLALHDSLPDLLSGAPRPTSAAKPDSIKVSLKQGDSALLTTPQRTEMEWNVR